MSDAPHPPPPGWPPPSPGWRPPPPHESGTDNPASQQDGHDPTRLLPTPQHRPFPDQRLHEQVAQPAEPKKKPPKWVWWVGGFVALTIIGALLSDTEDDAGIESTTAANEDQDTVAKDTTTATESSTGELGGGEEPLPKLVIQISMVEPPDEAGYFDGIEARKPEVLALFTPAELVELGRRSCVLRDGYVTGSQPGHQSILAEEIADSYRLQADLKADRVAGVVGNAADGSLCEATYVEQD